MPWARSGGFVICTSARRRWRSARSPRCARTTTGFRRTASTGRRSREACRRTQGWPGGSQMGTAFERVAAVTDVVEHACSYDMAAELVNGMDVLAVYEATRRAAERARKGGHPTLLEVRTYRFMGHSMSDPLHGVYRTKEEVEEQKKRDPISQLALKLKEEGALDDAALHALDAEVRAVVEAAVQFADQSPDPDLAELTSPVIEFMTWNFAVLALDQIVNSAAKILYESGGQVPIPIVFRGPNGAALQLAAQHSQAWESWLAHVPGLKVVAPATPADAKGLLKAAIRDDNPVIVLEGEMLYNTKGDVPEGEHVVPIGKADVKRAGTDVTLVCHSKTVVPALKAAEQLQEQGVSAEGVDLRSLRPMDEETLGASVANTTRCVVAEEGLPHCAIGAQVVDIIQREAFDSLDAPVLRVTQAEVPMPYNRQLERAAKPSPEKIVAAARRVCYLD